MQWYWWVLIAIAVVAIGYLKLKIWNNMKKKRAEKRARQEDD